MWFYVVFICSILFFFFLSFHERKKYKNGVFFERIALFIIVFISIFRFDVGWDYVNYYNYIYNVEILQILGLEPFSQLLCYVALYFNSPPLLFILFGLPTYLILFQALRRFSVDFRISILVYLAFFYLESFTSMRQTLALSITFWGFRYVLTRSFAKYFFVIVLAALFHMSALVALVIYPIYFLLNVKWLILVIPVIFLVKEVLFQFLSMYGRYAYYLDKLEEYTGGGIARYVQIFLFLSLLVLGRAKSISFSENRMFSIIGLALFFPFIFGPALGTRIGMYFLIFLCLLVPCILKKYSIHYKILYTFCFVGYFLTMIYVGSNNAFKSLYTPYQFIFNIESPQFR